MIEAYFNSSVATLKVVISKKNFNKIIKDEFLSAYIPSIVIREKGDYDAVVKIIYDKKNYIEFKYPQITYHYKKFDSIDVISLIEYVLERAREEKNIICIHGAGAIIDNKLIVSWGGTTGIGKTTLAFELSKKGSFYSDEKILIDLKRCCSVGGINRQYISNIYWQKKINTFDKYIVIGNNNFKKYEICLFIQPIICDSERCVLDKWDNKKFMWHLYEESCRKIRGTSRFFFDNTYPADSLDTFELASKRLKLIKKFSEKITAIYYKGNIKNIINEICK